MILFPSLGWGPDAISYYTTGRPTEYLRADCRPVNGELVTAAKKTTRGLPPGVFVRSLDALHLTCASRHGYPRIYSNDKNLVRAAPYFDLQPDSLSQ